MVKLRPVPQEPCRRREEPASVQCALRPGCPRGRSERRIAQGVPASESASEEQCSTPRPTHAAGRRLSLVERRLESRARSVRPLRVGDGPPGFLAGNAGKSQKLRQLSPERTSEWKPETAPNDPLCPDCSLRFSPHFAGSVRGSSFAKDRR